jgi:eukaryotic-like serine/threonine-protein kinase
VLIPTPEQTPQADAHSNTNTTPALGAGQPSTSTTPPTGPGQPSATAAAVPAAGPANASGPPAAGPSAATVSAAPAQPPTTGAPATTAPGSAEQIRTFSSAGGSIRAGCTPAGLAHLLSWTPAAPYRVDWVNAGPAAAATVAFAHGNRTIDMTVTCTGTGPVVATSTHARERAASRRQQRAVQTATLLTD